MRNFKTILVVSLVFLTFNLSSARSRTAAWPNFRGPERTGVAPASDPPMTWSEQENVRWKVELEGKGHASPVVWGKRIYVMAAVKTGSDAHQFFVRAYHLESGKSLWKTVVREEVPHESLHATASQASASPVTAGKHIWAFFGSRGLYCLNNKGKIIWELDLGTQQTRNEFGEGASPVLHGEFLIVNWDHEGESFVVGLNKQTGEERWRVPRDEPTSWSTPLVVRDGDRDVVVVSAANKVRGYDLNSGKEIWSVGGLGLNVIPTPVSDGESLWVMSGWREAHGMAIRFRGAEGDLTGTDRVTWKTDRGLSYVPSPVLIDGRVYFFQRFTGILSCYELSSGNACYDQQRIDGFENIYASPVAAGNRIYSVSRDGNAVVIQAGDDFEILAENQLDDVFNATPAIVGNSIILRGEQYLYHIAAD